MKLTKSQLKKIIKEELYAICESNEEYGGTWPGLGKDYEEGDKYFARSGDGAILAPEGGKYTIVRINSDGSQEVHYEELEKDEAKQILYSLAKDSSRWKARAKFGL